MGVPFLGEAQRPWARFSGKPACRRIRRSSRLRSGSPPCGGVRRSLSSRGVGHLRASRRPSSPPMHASSLRPSSFSAARVREPGTAERASVCLRPDGDRRMPGTRSSFSWRQALPLRPPLRPSSFSVSRVREPGTAEGDSVCLRPDGGRRMPGTRPPCLRRQASPVREVTCSAEPVNLVLRGARKGAQRWDVPGLTMCEASSRFDVHIV
jgi:hypothetical protein